MVQAVKTTRAVDQAARIIRQAILEGEYRVGGFLPSERGLAVELGVNRLTLRAALAQLEAEGLVRPEHGNGVRVLDYRATAGLGLLPHLLGSERSSLIRGFLELRRLIGAEAVAVACVRAQERQLVDLEELARDQLVEADRGAFMERDLAFSRAVIRSTGNLVLELLFNSLEQMVRAHPEILEAMLGDLEVVRGSYGGVTALIRVGDEARARELMKALFEQQDRATLARLGIE